MWEANDTKALRKIVGKTKIDRISQQIRESYGIQLINEWVERRRRRRRRRRSSSSRSRRRREWDQHVTRMDAARLVKISRDNIWLKRVSRMP